MVPTDSALRMARAMASCLSICAPASPTSPTTADEGIRTSSNLMTENRRVMSRVCMGVTDTPAVPAGTRTWVRPAPVRPDTRRWSARPPDSTGRLMPLTTTWSPSTRISKDEGAEPVVRAWFPEAPGGHRRSRQQVVDHRLMGAAVGVAQGRGHHVGGDERPRCGAATELVGHQREVDQSLPTDRSPAAVLADQQGRPSQLGATPPVLPVETVRMVAQPAQLLNGDQLPEEPGRGGGKQLLVGFEGQQHEWLRSFVTRGSLIRLGRRGRSQR